MGWLKHAFEVPKSDALVPTPRQEEILDRLAAKVVEWKMSVPAILFLESVKPLNFVGSQVLVFFSPIANSLFTIKDYDELTTLLEQRGSIELLLKRIEALEAGVAAPSAPARPEAPGSPGSSKSS